MEATLVQEVEDDDGNIGYLVVGTDEQCRNTVQSLEKKGPGYWYEIGFYERDNRNPGRSIAVWRFTFRNNGTIQQQSVGKPSKKN